MGSSAEGLKYIKVVPGTTTEAEQGRLPFDWREPAIGVTFDPVQLVLWVQMQQDTPRELARAEGNDVPALIASIPASVQQRGTALGIVIFFSVGFVIALPFASQQVGRVDAFIPVVQSIICVTDIITAALLFAQYSIQPQRALLALASGYLCGGLFAFLQTLEFPGAYSATGLLGGGTNGAVWLFNFWRITFALAVIIYALLKDANDTANRFTKNEPRRAIVVTVACTLAVTAGLTWLGTAGNRHLPNLYIGTTQQAFLNQYLAGALWLLNATAIVLLLARKRTILGAWLAVTVFMSLPDYTWAFFFSGLRFSLGWYMARTYSLIASFTVLVVLLVETTMLYARLASAITLQRRERAHQIMSVDEATAAIAHEINQPLGGILLNCETALHCLEREAPDVAEARECVTDAIVDSKRAKEVVIAVRALFKATARRRTMFDINRLVRDVLGMVENDLHVHGVSASAEFQEDVPEVVGDPTQLQQVILNLVKNAIEAIATSSTKAIRLTTTYDGKSVVSIYVQDTGPGVTIDDETQVFDPFFTTKPSGMGLGLSISRRIIEDHGGNLRLTETTSRGCTFEITLPV
jgi:signal transduction histidine kinase